MRFFSSGSTLHPKTEDNMKLKCTIPEPNPTEWIHLQSGKEFSRLLYTNPVCFLATTSSQPFKITDRDNDRKASATVSEVSTLSPSY